MNVVFDLDGTLLDVWARYFAVFNALSFSHGYSFNQYREMKRRLRLDTKVAQALGTSLPEDYSVRKRILLESDEMLGLDKPIISSERLKKWATSNSGIIVTKRRNTASAIAQLDRIGLANIFDEVVILDPEEGKSKTDWVKERQSFGLCCWDAVIGDGPEDVMLGRHLGIETVFVESGLYLLEHVKGYNSAVKSVADANGFLALP